MTTYYLASCWERHGELRRYREELQSTVPEAKVASRWLDVDFEFGLSSDIFDADPKGCWRFAHQDLEDIASSDVLISFTGQGDRGGRHAEYGFGMCINRRLVIIGPREHIFHTHPKVTKYESWRDFLSDERRRQAAEALLES